MAITLIPYSSPRQQFFDSSGRPLAGGKIYTYTAGTTTPVGTWFDAAGTIPNTNPIILDASGAATIFFNADNFYKLVVQNSLGVLQWMIDHLNPCACGGAGGGVTPPPGAVTLVSISVSPPWIMGGTNPATGTVTLSGPAPDGGATVSLVSSNFDIAQPGASVTVPAGATSATFPIDTSGVNVDVTVTITGAYGGGSAATTLIVGAPTDVTLISITLNPTSVQAGGSVTGTATMSGHTLGSGALVALVSSNPNVAQVPSGGVEVIAGQTTGEFPVTTTPSLSASTATITGHYGNDESATLIITAGSGVTLVSLTLSSNVVAGGQSLTGTLTLSSPTPTPAVVTLESSNYYLVPVPATVTIPAGQSSATFTITTSASIGSDDYVVAIDATYAGVKKGAQFLLSRPSPHYVFVGVAPPNQTNAVLAAGPQVMLEPSMYPLGQSGNRTEQVGDFWQFSPNGLNIYLVLAGDSRTFLDQGNNDFSMNPPIPVTIDAWTMYLYGSARSLYGAWTVKIRS